MTWLRLMHLIVNHPELEAWAGDYHQLADKSADELRNVIFGYLDWQDSKPRDMHQMLWG